MDTIKLSTQAKMKIIIQTWQYPVFFYLVITIGLIALYFWSTKTQSNEIKRSTQQQSQLRELNERINKIKIEEQEIINKSNKFIQLVNNNITKQPNQLDIQEFLFARAKLSGIGEFEYAFANKSKSVQDLKKVIKIDQGQKNIAPGNIKVSILPQTMKMFVLHELQFFNFLSSLNPNSENSFAHINNPHSLAQIEKCEFAKINPKAELSPVANNFVAECSLNWLNFEIDLENLNAPN